MALTSNPSPVTGNPGDNPPDRAKYGRERDPGDGAAAARASELNNAEPQAVQAVDGRCPVDGLPAGNCGHLPGPQLVTAPDGSTAYEGEHAAQEKSASREGRDRKQP